MFFGKKKFEGVFLTKSPFKTGKSLISLFLQMISELYLETRLG